MAGNAVGKRRKLRRGAQVPPYDRRRRHAAREFDNVAGDIGRGQLASRQHNTDGVDEGRARTFDCNRRCAVKIEAGDEIGDRIGGGPCTLRAVSNAGRAGLLTESRRRHPCDRRRAGSEENSTVDQASSIVHCHGQNLEVLSRSAGRRAGFVWQCPMKSRIWNE
jgi:hypothetical protein